MLKMPGNPVANFTDCSVASRVVVMVQWLAHPTSNLGDAGSILIHGIYMFFIKKKKKKDW